MPERQSLSLLRIAACSIDNDLSAQNVGISTADTVEQVVIQFNDEYVGMGFADNPFVPFYFVASLIDLNVDVMPYQAFDVILCSV